MEIIFFNVDHITSVYWPSNLILYLVCDFLAVNTILIWKRFQPHKHYITVFIFCMFRCVWLLYFYFEILSFSCNRMCILILLVYCITIYHSEIYHHDQWLTKGNGCHTVLNVGYCFQYNILLCHCLINSCLHMVNGKKKFENNWSKGCQVV